MRIFSAKITVLARRLFLALLLTAPALSLAAPAQAATPAEQFVSENVQKGLAILNDKSLSAADRRTQFQNFLMTLTDIKAIAEYTLGQYRRRASEADLSAFDSAFQDYALAVYESYFAKYTGQTLKVTGSYQAAPGETIVKTVMIDPNDTRDGPLEVDFRVAGGSHPVVVDFSVKGVWIREVERSDFTSYLGQHGGDITALSALLKSKAAKIGE